MNENSIMQRSYRLCGILSFLFFILSIIFKDYSLLYGYVLGYVISYIIFRMDIYIADIILTLKKAYTFISILFLFKLFLYGLGFFIAIKVSLFHIVSVFVGYLSTKISIYIEGYLNKGGEVNK